MDINLLSADSPFMGKRDFVRPDGVSFWSFLSNSKIPYSKEDFPFLTNHKIPKVKRLFDFGEYINLSSKGEALAYLYQGLGKAWNYVGPVLDFELKHGFNDHTDRHTLWVVQTGVELLQRAGRAHNNGKKKYDSQTEVLMTLVGMMHDLGNFMGRKEHSTYSAWLMTRLFYNYGEYTEAWRTVLYTVLFHEEPVLRDLRVQLSNGVPLQWALVAADKMHVGRDRIGGRSFESGIEKHAFEEDLHILLNSLVVRSAWVMAANSFVWHLDFSIDQLEEKFESFTKGDGKLWMPDEFHKKYVQKGMKYREIFAEMFSNAYEARIRMAAMSVFLLFPNLTKFQVFLTDAKQGGAIKSGELLVCELVR